MDLSIKNANACDSSVFCEVTLQNVTSLLKVHPSVIPARILSLTHSLHGYYWHRDSLSFLTTDGSHWFTRKCLRNLVEFFYMIVLAATDWPWTFRFFPRLFSIFSYSYFDAFNKSSKNFYFIHPFPLIYHRLL